jgi:hypothetical protein
MMNSQSIGIILFEIVGSILASSGRSTSSIFTIFLENGYSVIDLNGRILSKEEFIKPSDGDYIATVNAEDIIGKLRR